MALDYVSLLLAAALSGMFLFVALLAVWFTAREQQHLVFSAAGVAALVAHVVLYWIYANDPNDMTACVMLALLPVGMALVLASARYLYRVKRPFNDIAVIAGCSVVLTTVLILNGLDGAAFMASYFAATVFLVLSGFIHWEYRHEARTLMTLISGLFMMCAVSFALCCAVLLYNEQWVLGHAPDNWAERVNILVSVACMTGLGGLLLTLHNIRAGVRHETEARRDPLTGLLNRRALQSLYSDKPFGHFSAVAMFDLDHFKRTNDLFGHAAGDEALRLFGELLARHTCPRDHSFRLGGEEFALVSLHISPEQIRVIARNVADEFATCDVMTDLGTVRCTVSVGIAFGDVGGASLTDVLTGADRALYAAKHAGRNRVVVLEDSVTEQRKAG